MKLAHIVAPQTINANPVPYIICVPAVIIAMGASPRIALKAKDFKVASVVLVSEHIPGQRHNSCRDAVDLES